MYFGKMSRSYNKIGKKDEKGRYENGQKPKNYFNGISWYAFIISITGKWGNSASLHGAK